MLGGEIMFNPHLRFPEPTYQPENSPVTNLPSVTTPSNTTNIKPIYPFIYLSWDLALVDARRVLLFSNDLEIRKFRSVIIRSYILMVIWPLLVLSGFVTALILYPSYLLWFAWLGFLLFIFVAYRTKQLIDVLYFLKYPDQYFIPAPDYVESSFADSNNQTAPPPTYENASISPPAYHSAVPQA